MRLTDRTDFDRLAERARNSFDAIGADGRWAVSVGISECSIAKGARETWDHFRLKLEGSGLPHVMRRVGCGGYCWAEPFVVVSCCARDVSIPRCRPWLRAEGAMLSRAAHPRPEGEPGQRLAHRG